eukprot:m.96379 g.96379  ORF g.96379 m.96379 type:complete len:429 (+) comp12361_c0_seq8:78-1364(+)
MIQFRRGYQAFVGTFIVIAVGEGALITPNSPNLFFSPANWAREQLVSADRASSVAVAVNAGAYFRLTFTGSQVAIVQLIATNPGPVSTHYMNVAISADDSEFTILPIYGNSTSLTVPLRETSNASTVHTIFFTVYNSQQHANRWNNVTNGGAAVIVRGVALNDGATTLPPKLRPGRAVFFGDSITEGVNAECENPDPQCRGGDLCANSATKTWGRAVASAFDAEYGQVGFGSLGWTVAGAGGVPPVFTPEEPAVSSWNQIYGGVPRSFSNLDYIFVLHATNDGLRGATTAAVTASVVGWLTAVRAAAGPTTAIFLVVPFGGFGSVNAPVGSLKSAFDEYQNSKRDDRTFFIDLGPPAAAGLECGSWEKGCVGADGSLAGASLEGCDGIHPRGGTGASARHGELGAMLSVRAALALANVTVLLQHRLAH